jgi:hypothetical protein
VTGIVTVQGVDEHTTVPLAITFAPVGSLFTVMVVVLLDVVISCEEEQEFKTKTGNNNAITCRGKSFIV